MPFFGGFTRTVKPTYFDIRLDEDILWLPGEDDAGYSHLRGKLILCLSEPMRVQDIKLHLDGKYYVNWDYGFPHNTRPHKKVSWKEVNFYHQVRSFLFPSKRSQSTTLPPDNYEFPFEICLRGKTPETIQGMDDSFIKYVLKARIHCANGERIETTKDVKVCRAYRSLFYREPDVIENTWPDKVQYSIRIPSHAYAFGSEIKTDFRFIPLKKNLSIRKITSSVIETQRSKFSLKSRTRTVLKDEYEVPDFWDMDILENEPWFYTSRSLKLPQSTRDCLQTAQTDIMNVSHALRVEIRLINPDGHDSAVNLSFPLSLHFAPPASIFGSDLPALDSEAFPSDEPTNWLPNYHDHIHDRKPGVESDSNSTSQPYDAPPENDEKPPEYIQVTDLSKLPSYSVATQAITATA